MIVHDVTRFLTPPGPFIRHTSQKSDFPSDVTSKNSDPTKRLVKLVAKFTTERGGDSILCVTLCRTTNAWDVKNKILKKYKISKTCKNLNFYNKNYVTSRQHIITRKNENLNRSGNMQIWVWHHISSLRPPRSSHIVTIMPFQIMILNLSAIIYFLGLI